MELGVLERLLILNLDTLPSTGNIVTLKVKQQLLNDCGFSEDEIRDYKIVQDGQKVTWDKEVEKPKEVEIGEQGLKLLREALEKSDNLNDLFIPLYDRIKA